MERGGVEVLRLWRRSSKSAAFDRAERDRLEMQLLEIWSTRPDSLRSEMVKVLRASSAALRPFG
jgi:hypothetical protein